MKFVVFLVLYVPTIHAVDPVRLVNTNPVKICAECEKPIMVQFLVSTEKGINSKTPLDVVDVEVDGTHDTKLRTALCTTWDVNGGTISGIKLTISDNTVYNRQGTYTVSVRVMPVGAEAFYLKPQLTHPPATIDPPGTITIERVYGWFWWFPKVPQLQLTPKTQDAGLTDLSIRKPKPAAGPDGSTIGGSLDFGFQNQSVQVGKFENITLTLEGTFPFGKTTGQAEIAAPQLASPVQFTYEIVTRMNRFWILPAALIGVLLGLLTRVLLQGQIDRLKARITAQDLLGRVVTDLKTKLDTDFQQALGGPIADLKHALENGDLTGIANATKDLDTKWRTELQGLADRIRAATGDVMQFAFTVGVAWAGLPKKMQDVLHSAPVTALRKLIADSDAAGAKIALATGWQNLGVDLEVGRRTWRQEFLNQCTELDGPNAVGISAPNKDSYSANVQKITGKWSDFKVPPKDDIPGFLRDSHEDGEDARGLLYGLGNSIAAEWTGNQRKFVNPPDPVSVQNLTDTTQGFSAKLETAFRDPRAWPKPEDLEALQNAWLKAVVNNAPADKKDAVTALIGAGLFRDAVDRAFSLAAPQQDLVPQEQPETPPRTAMPVASMNIHVAAGLNIVSEPLFVQVRQEKKQLLFDQILMSLSVAALYSIIAFVTFGPKYVGDPFEWCTIILWGFALDYTMDAVVKSIPKRS